MTDAELPGTGPHLTPAQIRLVIGGLLLGMLLAALDQTIVATALPTIVGDLHGGSHLSWVVTAYLLASTASTPIWGKLGDQYGRKRFFQGAIVVFLAGSVLAGLSQSMVELIVCRALQGLGGGGLIVGAQASVGDVVSPRDRGRYQGIFGAVFGVSSVLGPLLGGFFVDHLSWRWIFYVNVPIGVVALVVTAVVLPSAGTRSRHVIDYLGTSLLALAATAVILLTSLGGITYRWGSAPIVGMGVAGAVLLAGFVVAERRAREPVIPLHLFGNRTFAATGAIGFVVGFAMFGAITFLPLYMQVVKGVSPTASGLRLLPLMAGLLVTSIGSGLIISRWGRYKVFPVVGTAVMGLGLYLLSHVGAATGTLFTTAAMVVLGLGLGMVMQVLVIAVQNAVGYEDLGTATSGATFFRSIGASFGVAIFGAIFSNQLVSQLHRFLPSLRVPAGSSGTSITPAQLASLPAPVHRGIVLAYAAALQKVFLVAVPVAAVAFALTWLLPEVPLRKTTQATDPADTLTPTAIPSTRTSEGELERALSVLARRGNRAEIYRTLAERAGVEVSPAACWMLFRLEQHHGSPPEAIAAAVHADPAAVRALGPELAGAGLISLDGPWHLTEAGHQAVSQLTEARRLGLEELLGDWSVDTRRQAARMLADLATDLLHDESAGGVIGRTPG